MRSSKIVMSVKIKCYLSSLTKKKHVYEDRSDSEKRGTEEKLKIILLQISANKCFLCSAIHFYETVIIFLSLYEVLAKSWRFSLIMLKKLLTTLDYF